MATYRSAAEWSAKTYRMAQTLPRINAARVERASLVIVDRYNAAVSAQAAGGRLRGTARDGRQPSRVRASFPPVRVPRTGHVTSLVGARGPAQLLEYEIAPHMIGSTSLGTRNAIKRRSGAIALSRVGGGDARGLFRASYRTQMGGRQSRRATKRALTINGDLRAYAFHPGKRRADGSGPWKRTLRTSKPQAVRAMQGVWADALRVR